MQCCGTVFSAEGGARVPWKKPLSRRGGRRLQPTGLPPEGVGAEMREAARDAARLGVHGLCGKQDVGGQRFLWVRGVPVRRNLRRLPPASAHC